MTTLEAIWPFCVDCRHYVVEERPNQYAPDRIDRTEYCGHTEARRLTDGKPIIHARDMRERHCRCGPKGYLFSGKEAS